MKQKLLICGAAAFAALFLFSGIMLGRQLADQRQSTEAFDNIADMVIKEAEPDTAQPSENSGEIEQPITLTAYEKYASVYEQNPDFVGWISIEGTNIDYPVMQTPSNPNFYLKHAFDQSYSNYGVPYVQENCDLEQSDNVVIYGHHMNNGSMFADLCKYESESFYQEHKTIHFDTLTGFGEYEVVAVFKTTAYSQDGFRYYHFVDAADEYDFSEFMAACRSLALYDTGVTAEYGDKLLTLSTCEYSRTNGRMVIVAKLSAPSAEEVDADAGY
jgi:sortase B